MARVLRRLFCLLILVTSVLLAVVANPVVAQDETKPDAAATELAHRYAPIIVTKQQTDECDPLGEAYLPMPVEIVLGNPQVALRQLGEANPVVTWGPTARDLAGLGAGFFLDFPGVALEPNCIYERDFESYRQGFQPTTYAHVVTTPARDNQPARVFVQYWFYWYFNDWNNKHESDWEGIAVVFEADSVQAALATEPVGVAYSQHAGGERAAWSDQRLQRDGDHPIVFPSAGSHASYFETNLWIGRSASEGVGCDNTTGPHDRYQLDVVMLPDTVDDPNDSLAWITYSGRWGERHGGSFNAPTGPSTKARWNDPAPWYGGLRDASVAVPAGEANAGGLVELFCQSVAFGSNLVVTATVSPTRLAVVVLAASLVLWVLATRTKWNRVGAKPLVRQRRAGQIIRAAVVTYATEPKRFLLLAAIYLPTLLAVSALAGVIEAIPFIGPLIKLALDVAALGNVTTPGGGVAQQLVAFALTAVATRHLAHTDDDWSVLDAAGVVLRRWRSVLWTWALSALIVTALALTIVGLPWAIRQTVRYTFGSQVAANEHLSGRRALARSAELVRGRWWHTAVISGVIIGLAAGLSTLVSLALFFIGPAIPLAITSALSGLVYALLLPIASVSLALLYGDAVAEYSSPDTNPDTNAEAVFSAETPG